jgi:uncharacterized protein YjdB
MPKHALLIIVIVISLLSCDDNKEVAELVPESIKISSSSRVIKPEQTLQIRAQVLTADNITIDDAVIVWSSDNTSIVKIDEKGILTAVNQGTTYIFATIGNVQSSLEITVSAIRRRILSELFTSST